MKLLHRNHAAPSVPARLLHSEAASPAQAAAFIARETKRWTEVTCFRGLIPRNAVAALRKADGRPLDHNPVDSFSMDRHRNDRSGATTYWVRGGELLNVWIARYEPNSAAFEQEEGDWFPVSREEILREVDEAFEGSSSREDLLALAGAIVRPTKWGLYDRDALETWVQGRICLLGDAAHPMLPTFGQGAAQSFEDAATLASAFALHGRDVAKAMLHYERVRHYRATRFQLGSKFAFDHLRASDTAEQEALLETINERVSPAFAHDKRGGEDDSWIYAYDARNIGAGLPPKRLGPWDFRRAAKADVAAITEVAHVDAESFGQGNQHVRGRLETDPFGVTAAVNRQIPTTQVPAGVGGDD